MDFIKYISNVKYYMSCEPAFEQRGDYPIGRLDDRYVYFQYYSLEEEAKEKWEDRTFRMDLNHLYVLMTERDGCTEEHMERFDKLPLKRKALLTHLPHPEISCAHYIKGFEAEGQCGILSEFVPNQYLGKFHYDQFDYVKWLNMKSR